MNRRLLTTPTLAALLWATAASTGCPRPTTKKFHPEAEVLISRGHQLRAPSLRSGPKPVGKIAWRTKLRGEIVGSVAVTGARVYVATGGAQGGQVAALDQGTGKIAWTREVGSAVAGTPAYAFAQIYVGTEKGSVVCLHAVSGEPCWRAEVGAAIRGAPIIFEDALIVGGLDKHVHAFDAESGKVKWRYATAEKVESTPLVHGGILYFGADDNRLHAVNPVSGKHLWSFETEKKVRAMPLLDGGAIFLIGEDRVYALDAGTGKALWSFSPGSPSVGGAIHDNQLHVVTATTGIQVLELKTGIDVFTVSAGKSQLSSAPAIVDGVLYTTSLDGRVYAFEAKTGKPLWQVELGAPVVASPVVHTGLVIVGAKDGSLVAIK